MSLWGKKTLENEAQKQVAEEIISLFADKNICICDASAILEYVSETINEPVRKVITSFANAEYSKPVKKSGTK